MTDLIEDCDSVKSRAYGILTPSPNHNYVGIFGDSNPLNLSEWVQLINTTVPSSAVVDQVKTQIITSRVLELNINLHLTVGCTKLLHPL